MLICSQECEEVLKEQCPPDLASVQEQDVSQVLVLTPNSLHSAGFKLLTSITYMHTGCDMGRSPGWYQGIHTRFPILQHLRA